MYYKLKEEKIKVEEDIIKKEIYYNRLHVINKKEEEPATKSEKDLISNYKKSKILITDKKPLDTYMPPGLIKSPNSGDLYKFNLYDEIKRDSKNVANNQPLNKIIANIENNKKEKNRVMTPRMLSLKKNDPEVKFKVLNEFISKIK